MAEVLQSEPTRRPGLNALEEAWRREAESASDEPVKLETIKLPNDVKKVLELLAEAQELPSSNRSEHIQTAHKIDRISQHLHAIQQGPESPLATAQNTRVVFAAQSALAKTAAVESLSRQHPVLREYLSDASATLEAANAKIEALEATIETLKNPKK